MHDYIERLSDELTERYKLYLASFLLDLLHGAAQVEFHVGYALRIDSKLHTRVFSITSTEALSAAERIAVIDALFLEIEDHIDETIASGMAEVN